LHKLCCQHEDSEATRHATVLNKSMFYSSGSWTEWL